MVIKNFLIHSKSIGKSSYLWNSASAMLNSFQTVVILMVISRIDPVNDAGIFVIAYAIGNLMLTIGRYGIRQFQASDVVEKYSYREYYYSRVLTTGLMLAISLFYIGFEYGTGQYDGNKSIVVLLICLVKWIDAFEDVFHGMLQQHDRLDIGGKILTVRLFLYTVLYMVLYAVTKDLILTSLISLLVSFALFVLLNGMALKSFPVEKGELSFRKIGAMLWECFPLFGSTFLIMYIGNAPKYAIDSVLSNQDQASFNYVFMPVFVISLLSNFIYQPVLNKLAVIWNQRETSRFWKLIAKYIAAILGLTAAVALGGYFLGIPVLNLIYGVHLEGYLLHLEILLVGGGLLALINFFTMIITIVRFQKYLIGGYIIVSLAFLLFGSKCVQAYGVLGISCFYTLSMLFLALLFFLLLVAIARRSSKNQ